MLLIWLLPAFQSLRPFTVIGPLDGDIQLNPDVHWNPQLWFNGSYSKQKTAYLNDQFGFRNIFVRLRNQINYSFFRKPTASDVVIGKNGFLYEEKYIKAYTGKDFIGESTILELLKKAKYIADTLKKLNIDLVLLYAPGKATFYPEYIPEHYFIGSDTLHTNYKYFVKLSKQLGLNYLDFNALFKIQKKTTSFPLYPKTGTHWSIYSMHYAFDTLVNYIQVLKQRQLSKFKYDSVEWSYDMKTPDDDIAKGLNTLFPIPAFKMAYPVIQFKDTLGKYRPRVLTVSDSYWMGIYCTFLPKTILKNHEFWYYYQKNMDYSGQENDPLDLNLKNEVENKDILLIMASEASLADFGWGIIDDLYNLYSKGEKGLNHRSRKIILERMKRKIRSNEDWMADVHRKAQLNTISVDSMITLDAIWAIRDDESLKKKYQEKPDFKEIRVIKNKMLKNDKWMEIITKKARNQNVSVDSMMTIDANWMINPEK